MYVGITGPTCKTARKIVLNLCLSFLTLSRKHVIEYTAYVTVVHLIYTSWRNKTRQDTAAFQYDCITTIKVCH